MPRKNDIPKLHDRVAIVQKAGNEIGMAIDKIARDYKLTYAEVILVLSRNISEHVHYLIRVERHPNDPDKGSESAPGS